MRLAYIAALPPLLAAGFLALPGCDPRCERIGTCHPYDGPTASTSSVGGASSSSDGSTTSSQGTGGGPPAGCELAEGKAIGADCGVFVMAGASGDGSQTSPFGDIQQAIAAVAAAPRVYVCGGDTFEGSIDLPTGVSIFGGLACDGWTYAAANVRPQLQGEANIPTVTVSGGSGKSVIDSVDIEAATATTAGVSSIAVDAVSTTLDLRNCDLTSGAGADGAPGTDGGGQANPAPSGSAGQPGSAVGSLAGGPKSADNVCPDGTTNGGRGGDGGPIMNNGGANGDGGDANTAFAGGFGETSMSLCTNGHGFPEAGATGTDSPFGDGAPATDFGTLSASAIQNASGNDGVNGTRGKGGGGGGGSKANTTTHGAGGGSGGAGGCGGIKGTGGAGGGSSVGIASLHSSVSLENVGFTLGAGGAGGRGGNGQLGQPGGNSGAGGMGGAVNDACSGGKGGRGGHGGSGGGGRGGHAIAIAYVGAPPRGTPIIATPGSAGAGGVGGTNGNDQGGAGADGVVETMQQLNE